MGYPRRHFHGIFIALAVLFAPARVLSADPSTGPPGLAGKDSHTARSAILCASYQLERTYRLAIAACDEALRLDPQDAESYSNRGAGYLMLGELDRAIVDFDAAIRLEPGDAIRRYNRATAYAQKREHDKAIADYTDAIRLNPKLAPAYNNRAYEFESIGERDKAIADYRKALELAPALEAIKQNLKRLGVD